MEMDWTKIDQANLWVAAMQQAHICLMCGKCCRQMDGIALNSIDTKRMAKHLGMKERDFIKQYTVKSTKKPSDRLYVLEGEDKHCPFLTDHGCCQYEGRGQVCRFYPWTSPENMQRAQDKKGLILYERCKGMVITYIRVLEEAKTLDMELAKGILSGQTGRICLIKAVDMEGRGEANTKGLLATLGLKEFPPEEGLKQAAFIYCAAYCRVNMSIHIDRLLRQLNEYLDH